MSEENVSKLRLKPKLAVEPEATLQQPVANIVTPESRVPASSEEPKPVRLKPKLTVAPAEPSEASVAREAAPEPAPFPPAPPSEFPAPVEDPAPPATEKPVSRFTLKPKTPAENPTPVFPPPPPEVMPAPALDEPIPAPLFVEPEQAMPQPVAIAQTETARPFPPPPANFPPPPSDEVRPAPPWAHSAGRTSAPKKKIGLIVAGGIGFLVVLSGGFVVIKKFAAVPPPPPVAERPKAPVTPAPVEKAKQEVAAPVAEIIPATPAAEVKSEPVKAVEAAPVPPPVPVVVEPPPASAAFKAWVENLRVGGVRPGASPRVMIGSNSYLIGDVVNPQLGITFDGYNADTRKLTFKDKSGAKVERRY